ncbi:MAG TPA: ferritin-like domain-containing protein [Gaiellaceae bacterium]|nr:ferritin-like domain-containing protein [Gaiellaceae bacterium]
MPDRVSVRVPEIGTAVRAAVADDPTSSRERFLRRAVVAGGTLVLGGVVFAGLPRLAASAAQSAEQDAEIFNFALLLEYMQAAFYGEAVERAELTGELLEFATVVTEHERAHVEYLRDALGGDARAEPTTDFGEATADPDAFGAAAVTLEDVAVAAYNGQAGNLTKGALRAAATIISVDARHAAWIRSIVGESPAAQAVDEPLSAETASARLDKTGFLVER